MNNNTYQESQLTSNTDFNGVLLDNCNYRKSNMKSLNTWIANAVSKDHINVFKYEILDLYDLKTEVTPLLEDMSRDNVMWARSFINGRWLICIMTNKGKDYADSYLNAHSNDFNLLTDASFDHSDQDEYLLLDIYSMGEHEQIKHFGREFATSGIPDKDLTIAMTKQTVIRKS